MPFPDVAAYAGGFGHVGEGAVAVVVVESVGQAIIEIGMAMEQSARPWIAACRLFFRIPRHVIDHEQVEPAVAIVIEPAGGHGPGFAVNPSLGRDVFEGAVAAVAVENVAAHAGDEQIGMAVVIVIGGCHAHAVTLSRDPGLGGDILENAIAAIAVKPIPEARIGFVEAGLRRAVGEENIQQAIAIVVEQRDAAEHGFDLMLFVGKWRRCAARNRCRSDAVMSSKAMGVPDSGKPGYEQCRGKPSQSLADGTIPIAARQPHCTPIRPSQLSFFQSGASSRTEMIWFDIQTAEDLPDAAGPANFQRIDFRLLAQPEVLAVRTGGAESFAAFHFAIDQQIAGFGGELRADGEAIALHAAEIHFQPVVLAGFQVVVEGVVGVVAGIVAAELGEDVERAVVIDVDEGHAVALVARAREADIALYPSPVATNFISLSVICDFTRLPFSVFNGERVKPNHLKAWTSSGFLSIMHSDRIAPARPQNSRSVTTPGA